jgi:hypothetical protein
MVVFLERHVGVVKEALLGSDVGRSIRRRYSRVITFAFDVAQRYSRHVEAEQNILVFPWWNPDQ